MGQTTDLQTTAIEFIQAAESLLVSGAFAEAESAVNACLMLVPGDKRALSLLERIKRKDALDVVSETSTILDSILSEVSGPFTEGSGAKRGRFLPYQVPDDGKEQAITQARMHEAAQQWSLAAKDWQEVLSTDPSDTWAWTQYAHLLSVNLQDFVGAEEAYREALDVDPTDDWAWGKLGILLADCCGDVEQGQEMLRRAIELDPSEAYYKAWLGWSLYNQSEEMEEAEELLQAAVTIMPSYQWAWFHLGYLLSTKTGREKEARAAYQKSIKLSPSDIASHFNLGVLYQEVFQQPKQALSCFKKVTSLSDEETASWRRIAFLQRDSYLDPGAAIKAFRKVVAQDGEDYEALTILGHLLWEESKDMAASLDALNQAIRIKGDSPWIWCHLGDYYCFGVHEIESAEVSYRKALELNPKFDWALSHLGALLLDHKDEASEAEILLEQAIEISPTYLFALQELIHCKQSLGRSPEQIVPLYDKVLEIEPDCIEIIIEYADLLGGALGRAEEGLERLKSALAVEPDHFYLQWSLLHYCRYDLGRLHEAKTVISELELCGEDEMSVACLLGRYYADAEGDFERAELWLRRAVDLAPDDHFAVHELGSFLLYDRRDFEGACEVLAQAALLGEQSCKGLGGDLSLANICKKPELLDQGEGLAWLESMDSDEAPQLEMLFTGLLLLIAHGRKNDALILSERMITLFPVASKSWLARLACLQIQKAPASQVKQARKKAGMYKAEWLDLDAAVESILNPLI